MHTGGHARVKSKIIVCIVYGVWASGPYLGPSARPSDLRHLACADSLPTTTIMPSHSNVSLSSTKTVTPSTFGADKSGKPPPGQSSSRIPVTPAVLRGIFASSRTVFEERSISRAAFFRQVSPALSVEKLPIRSAVISRARIDSRLSSSAVLPSAYSPQEGEC